MKIEAGHAAARFARLLLRPVHHSSPFRGGSLSPDGTVLVAIARPDRSPRQMNMLEAAIRKNSRSLHRDFFPRQRQSVSPTFAPHLLTAGKSQTFYGVTATQGGAEVAK
jgi:hypothetical protein